MKIKVGIFGGTFDPFTVAHMEIVKSALDHNLVDEVHIIPSVVDYYREDKDKWILYNQRYYIISRFVEHFKTSYKYNNRIYINDFEYDFARNNAPYIVNKRRFIDTLNQFIYNFDLKDDDVEYYTIIGTDSYKNFKTWSNWEEILKLSKLIVVNGRNGEFVETYEDVPKIDLEINHKFLNVSSTEIRSLYKNTEIEQYISDMLSTRVIESTQCTTPIFDLVKKTIHGLDFRPVGINSKDWVSIIVEWNGKYRMVRQLRYGLVTEQIEFPCGMIEKGEEPIDAAKRELKEETGINIIDDTKIKYLGKYAANPAFMNNFMYYFYVNLDDTEFFQGEIKLDEHENLTDELMDINEFENKILNCDPECTSVFMALGMHLVRKLKEIKN